MENQTNKTNESFQFDLNLDPHDHFQRLFKEAEDQKVLEHNAMTLATVGADGRPSARIVYFKGMVRGGFSFYTSYEGKKAKDLDHQPWVCVNFFWPELHQQIRITGAVTRLTHDENENYFKTRPRESQLGAWASHQSAELQNYEAFQNQVKQVTEKFAEVATVPCPPQWGGYRIEATEFEFWFGRSGRYHERYIYQKTNSGKWRTFMRNP
ncbi:MAG TPA: pyridoxamine 5'-phosphate oxidase [Pseudobdellovibrionaceae bacterium]|nr:pyridoxamine 5'-phosphate oxidase [Pseudobdellovibrionaceae bacterium]